MIVIYSIIFFSHSLPFKLSSILIILCISFYSKAVDKHTPHTHADRLHLVRAMSECQAMLTGVNESIRASQLYQQFEELSANIKCSPRYEGKGFPLNLNPVLLELKHSELFTRIRLKRNLQNLNELKIPPDLKGITRYFTDILCAPCSPMYSCPCLLMYSCFFLSYLFSHFLATTHTS